MDAFIQSVAAEDPAGFWLGIAFAVGIGAWLLRRGLRDFWRLRLIVDTPTARIRSAPQGYVELQGVAAPLREPMTAPLTGTTCVWYRWRIERWKRSGRSGSWVTLEQGSAERPLLVDDGTGTAEVQPNDAHLHLRHRRRWEGPNPHGQAVHGGGVMAFFERHIGRRQRHRMTEERIHAGEPVYVLGHFETPRRGVREREALTRTLLARWKRDPARMQAIDRNGDGEVDLKEWERARQEAARLAERAEARVSADPPRPRVSGSGDPDRPFVVSTEDEATLLAKLRLSAFGGTALGALLCAGAAAVVLARLT